jgi:hypothetical protein
MYIFGKKNEKCWLETNLEEGKQKYLKENDLIDDGKIFYEEHRESGMLLESRDKVVILKLKEIPSHLWLLDDHIYSANGSYDYHVIDLFETQEDAIEFAIDLFHQTTIDEGEEDSDLDTEAPTDEDVENLKRTLLSGEDAYTIPYHYLNEDHMCCDYTFMVYKLI